MNAAPRILVMLAAGWAALAPVAAFADDPSRTPGFFDRVLETLDVKAKPADPSPDFVTKTRPDPSRLDYIQRPVPHKVSPIPTKSAAEVERLKGALDAARAKQLTSVPPPVQIVQPQPIPAPEPPN